MARPGARGRIHAVSINNELRRPPIATRLGAAAMRALFIVCGVDSCEKLLKRDAEAARELDEIVDGDVATALLDADDVGAVESDHQTEAFLRKALLRTQGPNPFAEIAFNLKYFAVFFHQLAE